MTLRNTKDIAHTEYIAHTTILQIAGLIAGIKVFAGISK